MKLRDSAAAALAAWHAMTMTGPAAPPAPNAAAMQQAEASAIAAWHQMTGTQPVTLQPPGATQRPQQGGAFPNVPVPSYTPMAPGSTPLRDNPTQIPNFGPGSAPPAPLEPLPTFTAPPEMPPPTAADLRGLDIDEKIFTQGNELLQAAYQQGYAVAPYLGAAGMPPPKNVSGPPGARIDGYRVKVAETFDDPKNSIFSNHWGPGVDTSVPGQITVWTSAENHSSGMMTNPEGYGTPAGGWGYGLYSFTLQTEGKIGVYALTWPATDVWPGPEMDVLEIDPGGKGYSAIHHKGEGNSNQYEILGWGDVDLTKVHTYSLLWEEGRLTGFIDGQQRWTTTENVPKDYANGGENTAPGIGAETWWNDGAMGGRNKITLYGFSYEAKE